MRPYEFEQLVCDHYSRLGYRASTTAQTGDYGICRMIPFAGVSSFSLVVKTNI